MLDPGLDARTHFLENSARSLQGIAPSTSAHLMHERDAVAEERGKTLNKTQFKDICRACGTILVADMTSKVDLIESCNKRMRKKRKMDIHEHVGSQAKQTWRIECLCCRRVTRSSLQYKQPQEYGNASQGAAPPKNSQSALAESELPSSSTKTELAKPESANASSKKRAKARKQGGLQALLEKSKGLKSQYAGPGLDLMDFMKEV